MSGYSDDKQTHFGFQSVGEAEKREKVLEVFHNVADSYDMMNDVMSAGVHRLWKDYFVRKIRPGPEMRLLDVAGGTGDIAFRYLDSGGGSVVVCDINKSMLSVGEDRARQRGLSPENISWVEGDAQVRSSDRQVITTTLLVMFVSRLFPSQTTVSTATPSPSASATWSRWRRHCGRRGGCCGPAAGSCVWSSRR